MLQLGVYALVVRGEGQDLLMGTNVQNYIKVPGLENLLHSFILDLDTAFNHIYSNNIDLFLAKLQNRISLTLTDLEKPLNQNISQMQKIQSDPVMIYYLVITKTLEHIRKTVFQTIGIPWLQNTYQKLQNTSPPPKWIDDLQCLDTTCSKDYSLLYNLVFIYYLAQIYKDKKVEKKTNDLISKALINIVKKDL